MIVDFGSCLHAPPSLRDVAAAVSRQAAEPRGTPVPLPDGATVAIGGASWIAQSGRLDGIARDVEAAQLAFRAATGEKAGFDSPAIVRAELCGARRYARGEEIYLRGTIRVEAGSTIQSADWCSIIQIHQADTRQADGTFVRGSPIFAMHLGLARTGKPVLRVTGETSRGVPAPGTFARTRRFGEVPFDFASDHSFEIRIVDGHGGPGRITVMLDGRPVVDRTDLDTGYEYVDLLAKALDPPQQTGSYLKMGIYAGRFTGSEPPHGFDLRYSVRDLSTTP